MTSPRSGEPTSESEVPEAMPGIPDATLSSPTFFETSSGPVSSTSASEFGDILSAPIEPDEIGRLGNYRVLSVLGRGGMGVVFRARDPQLNRVVALKVMRPEIARNPQAAERFLREARAAATVKHDHIITIFQVGKEGGVPFIALEFLKGEGLDERMNRERILPHMEVSRIGHQTALGLAAAHAEGLIHRDIKPANIWLEAPSGRVKILDFGLARTGQDNVNLTGSGTVVGTPAYMSPEQANGDPVDHRSDLFSLGVMLYRMATGEAPFRGEATLAILTQLAIHVPPPPRSLNSAVPQSLSDLIMRLLEKKPDNRVQSAQDLARQLAPPPASTVQIIVEALPDEDDRSTFAFEESGTEIMPLPKAAEPSQPVKQKPTGRRKVNWLVPALSLLGVLMIGLLSWQLWKKFKPNEEPAVAEGGKEERAPKPKFLQPLV